jgi:hypothetical protein
MDNLPLLTFEKTERKVRMMLLRVRIKGILEGLDEATN